MKKRVLWLLNHTSLRRFEVPLLIELGYEVFCPKIFQVGSGDGSASITYEYDGTLSIPRAELDKLNCVDFYETISVDTMEIVNRYFDIAMFHYFPKQFKSLVKSFHGVLVFQAFGLLSETSYTSAIIDDLGVSILQLTKKLGNRFFFAQAYPHLRDIECQYFQQRTIDMPLGLEKKHKAEWVGGDSKFLFVLPRINYSNYFNLIYREFKKNFHGMEYVIAGSQPISVTNDARVTGFMSKEEYRYTMNHCAAMFYHSTEKNHIHYHPFEAVQNGMPLVFMGGGMIDLLGGKGLPGRCENVREARRKLRALSNGNARLTKRIIESQGVLLDHFLYENCKKKWESGMGMVSDSLRNLGITVSKKKKIAVILPQPYLGGVLDYTLRLVKCIVRGAAEHGEDVAVVLGYPADPIFEEKNYFKEVTELGVSLRSFKWLSKEVDWLRKNYQLMDVPECLAKDCCVMDDGIDYFEDCDYLIFTADRIPSSIYSSRPYIVVAHDYIQRYLPQMFGDFYERSFIDAAREAEAVFVTTPATQADAIQYAGIKAEKVLLTPLMFDLMSFPNAALGKKKLAKNYFLWSTNTAEHKNHLYALRGLADYYHKGGKLLCVLTGVNTELFDVRSSEKKIGDRITPYIRQVRQLIEQDEGLKSNLYVKGNLPKEYYTQLLQEAKFVFHPGYGDNGNGTAIDAACLGVPTICSDYPAMRYIDSYVGLNAHFFDPFDEDSICLALQDGEISCAEYAKLIPAREQLKRFTVEGKYSEVYEIIYKVMRE